MPAGESSEATDGRTREFFGQHECFGLNPEDVTFFVQGMLPVVDAAGKLMLESPGRLCVAPDGHGGTVKALANAGLLATDAGDRSTAARHLATLESLYDGATAAEYRSLRRALAN